MYAIVTGSYRGREITLRAEERYERVRFGRRHATDFTQIRLSITNLKAVSLRCDNSGTLFAFDALKQKIGLAEPLRTGNGVFDAMYHFSGEPGETVIRLMQAPQIQSILCGLQPTSIGTVFFRLDQTGLVYEREGFITDPTRLQRLLEIGCELAHAVEERLAQL